jgi:hypothetical protein
MRLEGLNEIDVNQYSGQLRPPLFYEILAILVDVKVVIERPVSLGHGTKG